MADNDLLAQALRTQPKVQAASSLRDRYKSLADSANTFTVGQGAEPKRTDWGNIILRGLGNYAAGKQDQKVAELEAQKQSLNEQFMKETLGSNPEAMKLYNMARAGLPGAADKLGELIAPKKQPLATATQFFANNPDISDESVAAMAQEMGYSPQLLMGVRDAAVKQRAYSSNEKTQAQDRQFGQQKELAYIRASLANQISNRPQDPNKLVGNTGLTYGEFMALPQEQRTQLMQMGKERETTASKEQAKATADAKAQMPGVRNAIGRMQDIINFAANASVVPGVGGMIDPRWTKNRNNAMLGQAINQLVLDATNGSLGAGVSNADVQFLKDAAAALSRGRNQDWVAQLRNGLSRLVQKAERYSELTGEPLQLDFSGLPTVQGPQYESANSVLNKYLPKKKQQGQGPAPTPSGGMPPFDKMYEGILNE